MKKRLLTLMLLLILTCSCSNSNSEKLYYAKYSKGNVYIGDADFLNNLDNLNPEDILILDYRFQDDPVLKVYNSYSILDSNEIDEILEIIKKYEEEYPSEWDRSIDSMKNEWLMHNFLYFLNYRQENTKDVDFNNADEKVYEGNILTMMKKYL